MFISTYQLLNMFRATMCPSSGADDLVVFSLTCGVVPWLCRQLDPVSCSCVRWKVRSTTDFVSGGGAVGWPGQTMGLGYQGIVRR